MALIDRPCYCTREQVRRALDVQRAAYNNEQIDRAILSGTESVEKLCQRRFYPVDATYKFDWPNYQYAYPWRLWLDQYELAAPATQIVSGTFLPAPVQIPIANVIFQPVNEGPPYTSIELRRDTNSAFGNNTTPQLDIGITGTFGYWMQTHVVGQLLASMQSTDTTVQVSNGALIAPGDVLIIDSERMIVTDMTYIDTSQSFSSGITAASAADRFGTVANGSLFASGEVVMVDFEWMLIENIVGNNIVVKRGYDGSLLTTHTDGTHIWAARQLSLLRGQLGTAAAAHSQNTNMYLNAVPSLVRDTAMAEALMQLVGEPGAYAQAVGGLGAGSGLGITVGGSGRNQAKEAAPGTGLADVRDRLYNSRYTRKARTRVI